MAQIVTSAIAMRGGLMRSILVFIFFAERRHSATRAGSARLKSTSQIVGGVPASWLECLDGLVLCSCLEILSLLANAERDRIDSVANS